MNGMSSPSSLPCCEVRVVTFDLDNTLWNTTITIDIANDALANYMNDNLIHLLSRVTSTMDSSDTSGIATNVPTNTMVRVETIMGKLFAANKTKYCPMDGATSKSPVLLTQLRRDAIHNVVIEFLKQHNYSSLSTGVDVCDDDDDLGISNFVNTAFDVWTRARHDAISLHMTPSTIYVLEQIQSLFTSQNNGTNKMMIIGAITDGNSDPKSIPELSSFFDFCINAEMVGVSKPNKRIYLQAVAQAMQQHPSLHNILPPIENGEIVRNSFDLTDDQLEELVGPWWVHIGDDFVKDIVASKSLNMRNIWTKELIAENKQVESLVTFTSQKQSGQQRTVDELIEAVNENKVVEMPIGADYYLADSIRQEFADAVVDKLHDVVEILRQWQNDAVLYAEASAINGDDNLLPKLPSIQTPQVQDDGTDVTVETNVNEKRMKFCIACGTRLPVVSRFCSSCGERQNV
jgi:FMN phosphatase YigB (HAD superfamily)